MTHAYVRHCYTSDGRHLEERVELTGDDVAIQFGGRGGRLEFLELVNKWNRVGLLSTMPDSPLYLYIAESPDGR